MMKEEHRKPVFEAMINELAGPVRAALTDPEVSEIMINGPRSIFIDGARGIEPLETEPKSFQSADQLRAFARAILQYSGKRLSPFDPSQEARLPDGSRVHVVQDPASRDGLSVTIRRFKKTGLTLEKLVESGSLTDAAGEYLIEKVTGGSGHEAANLVISGGTGTGKTTLLRFLASFCDPRERIITIEDVSELDLQSPHVVALEAQMPDQLDRGGITIRDLFRATLRMRPDRIIVGECRGGEALDMMQAMNSGHRGSLTTVHADDTDRALSRLETLCLMSDIDIPLVAVRRQIFEAIDVVVQVERRGQQRLIKGIGQMDHGADFSDGIYPIQNVFERDENGVLQDMR